MTNYNYLIIGGGMAGDAAVRGIRQVDEDGSIGLISTEEHPPYNRPPLSKRLWFGGKEKKIWRKTDLDDIDFYPGKTAVKLDTQKKEVTDDNGDSYQFDKLLLATGGNVIRLPFGGDHIIYFRTLNDYRRLKKLAEQGKRFAVIGGGFIGSEIAAALAHNEKEVVMLFPEEGIGARIFPLELSDYLNNYYHHKGVDIRSGELVSELEEKNGQYIVKTDSGHQELVDGVVAGIGIKPNVGLAEQAGLEVNKGIVVNQYLQSSHPDVYAAGDVAEFYTSALNKQMVVEHEENANMTGFIAGQNMAGQSQEYDYLPYFYSDLFDLGYEAVGEMNADMEIAIDWKQPLQEGVIYYLKNQRVRGVLLWNIFGNIDEARQLISEKGAFNADNLKGRI